ncbi:hypothetical protein A3F66_03070 [candidate division TM6 bacterium RIFCSPHIGHO2_12_FULL_32_22]|nr:MAG: hypothetical protein A3F66_03070 [candidate division TM6 bacterium RIFCSPHIGHO2_12_FULL_32_22]
MKNLFFVFLIFNASILSCDLHETNHKIRKRNDFKDRQKALIVLQRLEQELHRKRFIRMALNTAACTHLQRPSKQSTINFLKVGFRRNLELLTSEYKKKNLAFFPDFIITYQFQLEDGVPISIVGPEIDIETLKQEIRFETSNMHRELEAITLSFKKAEIDEATAGPAE